MGTDTIVSKSTILILIRFFWSRMNWNLRFQFLLLFQWERLKFWDLIFRKCSLYCVQAGGKSSAVSCVIYFCCLVFGSIWEEEGNAVYCMEIYFYNVLNVRVELAWKLRVFRSLLQKLWFWLWIFCFK
jgi:hypothetical protein